MLKLKKDVNVVNICFCYNFYTINNSIMCKKFIHPYYLIFLKLSYILHRKCIYNANKL